MSDWQGLLPGPLASGPPTDKDRPLRLRSLDWLTVEFGDGEVGFSDQRVEDQMVLARRQLTQLIFGAHASAEPVECGGRAGEILRTVFPYYFPIWELDHS